MLRDCLGRRVVTSVLSEQELDEIAAGVVRTVSAERSTWTRWNLYAETERALRHLRFSTVEAREQATESVLARATGPWLSIRIAEPDLVAEPDALTRASDGQSVFVPHGSERYTTSEVLVAEDALVAAARAGDGPSVDPIVLDAALAVHESRSQVRLDDGQRALVTAFATSTARLAVGIGPAGAGKTTAMQAFAVAWQAGGGRVVLLASSSKAAQVLGDELSARAENLHKFLHENAREQGPHDAWFRLGHGDVVVVDEAGMAGTLHLAALLDHATKAGASVRLLGDPAQLAAVDAGGAMRLLEREVGASYLTDLHRFRDPTEGAATLALRAGDVAALEFYERSNRIRSGSRDAMLEEAYAGWATDVQAGRTSVLIAAATADVPGLNARARTERMATGQVEVDGLELHDGNRAGVGDWVVTRANARTLSYRRGRDWVRNGDTWRIVHRHGDGSLTVRHLEHGGRLRLPATYVADSVELAYAATAHRVQGATTDTAHALVTPEMTREALYVSSTRGRAHTTWYTATETPLDVDGHTPAEEPATVREVLTRVLARSGTEDSATHTIRATLADATSLRTLVARYTHARSLAATDALREAANSLPADAHSRNSPRIPVAPHSLCQPRRTRAGWGADAHVLQHGLEPVPRRRDRRPADSFPDHGSCSDSARGIGGCRQQLRDARRVVTHLGEYLLRVLTQQWSPPERVNRGPRQLDGTAHDRKRTLAAGLGKLDEHLARREMRIPGQGVRIVDGPTRHLATQHFDDLGARPDSRPLRDRRRYPVTMLDAIRVGGIPGIGGELGSPNQLTELCPEVVTMRRDSDPPVIRREDVEGTEHRVTVALGCRHGSRVRVLVDDAFT